VTLGRRLTPVKWVEFVLATLPATALAGLLVMLGSGVLGGLLFAALAHITARDLDGLTLDLKVLAWLGGSMLGATWGVAALWLAAFRSEHDLRGSPTLRWFVILGLVVGLADVAFWLSSRNFPRKSLFYVYPLAMASLAGLRNLIVLTVRRAG
jgi:hypothetical protein